MSDIDFWAETQRIILENLPTVHRSNYVAPDMESVIDPLLDFEPACESPRHPPEWDCQAKFLQLGCCSDLSGLRCESCVNYNKQNGPSICDHCGRVSVIEDFQFIPLDLS